MSNSQSRKWTLVINNPLECEFTERQKEILKAGSLLQYTTKEAK